MATRLQGRLPNVEALKLTGYEHYRSFPKSTFHENSTQVPLFLSNLKLTSLHLVGFHPKVLLHALNSSGTTLRYLRFHIRENATDLQLVLGPSYSTLLLSTPHVENLRLACPILELLELDVCRSDLVEVEGDKTILPTDRTTPPPSGLPLLTTFAKMPSLRHIRLFLHFEPRSPWSLSSISAISTFTYIRNCKRGHVLQSLIICMGIRPHHGLWSIYELGPRLVALLYRQNGLWLRGVWDTEEMIPKRLEQGIEDAPAHPEWGIGDEW